MTGNEIETGCVVMIGVIGLMLETAGATEVEGLAEVTGTVSDNGSALCKAEHKKTISYIAIIINHR